MITQRFSTKLVGFAAVGALALLPALSACTSGSTAQEPQATATPNDTATPEPTAATPTPPALYTIATKPTQAGAEAFVQYWWELYSYAIQTNDGAALMKASDPECTYCTAVQERTTEYQAEGLQRVGGEVTLEAIALEAGDDKTSFVFKTDLKQAASEFVNAAGDVTSTVEAVANPLYVWVLWSDGAWRMRQVSDSVTR